MESSTGFLVIRTMSVLLTTLQVSFQTFCYEGLSE